MLKKFNQFINENKDSEKEDLKMAVLNILHTKYPASWWNDQFEERVYDYASEEDIIGDGTEDEPEFDSAEEYYTNHCMGGAVEYDLLDMISNEISTELGADRDAVGEIVSDFMIDNVSWCDTSIFRKSDFEYNKNSDYDDLVKGMNFLHSQDLTDKAKDITSTPDGRIKL